MTQNKINISLDFLAHRVIGALLAISVLSLVSIPLALAGESQASFEGEHQAQPTVHASASPDATNSMEQALESQLPKTSVAFLMERSPTLSQASVGATLQPVPSPAPEAQAVPAPLPEAAVPIKENSDEIAMLVSEQCSQSGDAADGTSSCERIYSNGHHATVLTQSANEGDELKRQTVIEEFDDDNTLLFKKTIRHRVDYNYWNDQKSKEKEFFDITYQPAGKKTTRELMVYEYFLNTGKTRSLSWTQYKQIASDPKAELVYNALLRYGADGHPDRGIAEEWHRGEKTETFMNWNRQTEGSASLDPETWQQWEGWIRNVSVQAYLP